jgi:ParB/RepB/Spo0J family partition protein
MTMAKRDVLDELDDLDELDQTDELEDHEGETDDQLWEDEDEEEGSGDLEDASDDEETETSASSVIATTLELATAATLIHDLPIDAVDPDPSQVRDEGADAELALEITAGTVLPPIEVRPHPDPARRALGKTYEIVDGERRFRGSIAAGRTTIRAIINDAVLDDGSRLLRQLQLNAGKKLKPMEEARSWKRVMTANGWNLQQIADAVHKPKSTVSDRLAMLNAPAVFQPLFTKGILPPAAAPIIRKYKDVPEHILKAHVEELVLDDWHDFATTETPVPLSEVEPSLDRIKWGALRRVYSDELAGYTGPTCTIGNEKFATDIEAFEAARRASYMPSKYATDRTPSKAEEERKKHEASERKKQQLKLETRRAQFEALSAKLPTSIGGSANGADWSQLLVELIMQEVHQDTLRVLAAQLKLTGEKSRDGGMDRYGDLVKRYAKSVNAQGRVRLALQLLLAPDINIPSYIARGPERFAAAAKLLKLDLSKIKPPADEKATKAPAKASTKRKR